MEKNHCVDPLALLHLNMTMHAPWGRPSRNLTHGTFIVLLPVGFTFSTLNAGHGERYLIRMEHTTSIYQKNISHL